MAYDSTHTGQTIDDAVTKATDMPGFKTEVANYASLPGSPSTGDVYLVTTATTGYDAGFYRYSGSAWVYMGNPRQDADDIDDTSTTHKFVTEGDLTTLSNTSGTNTGDQDLSSYQLQPSEGAFVNGDKTKLDGISTGANVTNTSTVTAAGALMDSEVTNLAQVKAFDSSDYATSAQGTKADSALQDLSDDTTPQLGGNLDVNGNDIVSTSNADIDLAANGTGSVVVRGNDTSGKLVLNCENNSHGVTIKGPPHSAAATYTLTLPNDDGAANGLMQSNGSGVLSFTNAPIVTTLDMAGAIQEKAVNTTSVTGSTALDPANGTIQRLTFSGAVGFTDSLVDGESITLIIDDGSGNLATWPTMEWVGGSAPTLDTTNEHIIVVWKVNSTLYGMASGVAS
jgi:hypothetical protein